MRSPWKHPSKNEQKTKRSNAARKPLRLPIVVYYYDNIIVLDATSHKNCVPHMNGGVSQADIGFIVISAQRSKFERSFERGGQTGEHAVLEETTDLRQMIIFINKAW